jgi:hypothetical protein
MLNDCHQSHLGQLPDDTLCDFERIDREHWHKKSALRGKPTKEPLALKKFELRTTSASACCAPSKQSEWKMDVGRNFPIQDCLVGSILEIAPSSQAQLSRSDAVESTMSSQVSACVLTGSSAGLRARTGDLS